MFDFYGNSIGNYITKEDSGDVIYDQLGFFKGNQCLLQQKVNQFLDRQDRFKRGLRGVGNSK